MAILAGVDWTEIFKPDTPLLEIFIRGTAVYLCLFAMLRLVSKRQAGTMSISDLLVIVLIADAVQNAMADDYKSLPDGLLLAAVLVFWNFALDWLAYRLPRFGRFVHPKPLPLVKDGRLIPKNLRMELMTEDELFTQLREQGVEDLSQVKIAQMEGDGRVSVIQKDPHAKATRNPKGDRGI